MVTRALVVGHVTMICELDSAITFYERDADGLPHVWLQRVRASLRTALRRFTADRMPDDYVSRVYLGESRR